MSLAGDLQEIAVRAGAVSRAETAVARRSARSSSPTVTVVVPALNEGENLPYVLPKIDHQHEVLLVDGRSTDNTCEIAPLLHPRVQVLQQRGRGKGDALRTGFQAATGEVIVSIDADGSTDPLEIPAFVGALVAGADFVKGSRFLQGAGTEDMPFYRKLGNRALTFMVRALFGGRYSDLCYGFNAFWRDVVHLLDVQTDGFEVETAVNIRALREGLRVVEVASFESRRIHGTAKLRAFPDGWRVLKTILRERFRRLPAATVPRSAVAELEPPSGVFAD